MKIFIFTSPAGGAVAGGDAAGGLPAACGSAFLDTDPFGTLCGFFIYFLKNSKNYNKYI